MDIIWATESIKEGTETLGAQSLGYCALQKNIKWFEKGVQKEKRTVQCCV